MTDALEAAWDAVHEALPARWQIGPVTYDPGRPGWTVSAVDLRTTGRGRIPRSVTGIGGDEAAALRDLDDRLRGVPKPDGTRMEELRRRLRLAYLEGAAQEWQRQTGRPPVTDELARTLGRYPGDPR